MSAIVNNISKNISLQKLSWLAAVPISLAAYGAVTNPAQANPHDHYNPHARYEQVDSTYCSRWEYRNEYRCVTYYRPRTEVRYYPRYEKPAYNNYQYNHHPKKSYYTPYGK